MYQDKTQRMNLKAYLISIGRLVEPDNDELKAQDETENELMDKIVKHYHSYKAPYDINNPGDLESLVSGFIFQTGVEVDQAAYKTAVTQHQLLEEQAVLTVKSEEIFNINI